MELSAGTILTRKQYMEQYTYPNNGDLFRMYYKQFVSDRVLALVHRAFTTSRLVRAFKEDEAFNTIPLRRWDGLVTQLPRSVVDTLTLAGDSFTLSTGVCVLKRAARMIVEDENISRKPIQ